MKSPKDFEIFLNSLPKPEKGQAEEMHGWRFDAPISEIRDKINAEWLEAEDQEAFALDAWDYFEVRCARAESLRVPDLKERVKELVRDAMDAVETFRDAKWGGEHLDERERKNYKAFCALCEPTKEAGVS